MENRICTILGIEKPVIQGPMVYLTDAKLVATVSNAGGLGSLGPHAGQVDSTKDPIERAERLRAQIKQVKQLTDKPFSVNVLPSQHHEDNDLYTPPQLDVIFEEEVPVVTFVGEPNKSMIRMFGQFKERGIKIVYRSLNPTPENTRAAEEAGADIIVATGFDEGDTLHLRQSFSQTRNATRMPATTPATATILPAMQRKSGFRST
ncbi:nitronate monooxygenase [Slackia heliotrinireducens]|uniref:nitronate monooxygenase n=1 Tax=Slackia heliotrinireducens TaxID=84110 RepID=UPI0033148604